MTTDDTDPTVPLGVAQLGLFPSDEMVVDTTFAAVHRIELDATSWVEHIPGWLTGGEQLLAALVANAGWEKRYRWMVNRVVVEPRLTAQCHELADAPEPRLRTAAAALSEHYGVPYDLSDLGSHRDRFSLGLALDIAAVLIRHGYPALTAGADLIRLQQALFGLIYQHNNASDQPLDTPSTIGNQIPPSRQREGFRR